MVIPLHPGDWFNFLERHDSGIYEIPLNAAYGNFIINSTIISLIKNC